MKTKFISLTVFALAIIGALTTHAMNNSTTSLMSIQGYIQGNPTGTICTRSVWCSDIIGPICMSGTTQIYGKDASGRCIVTLYADTFK
jgi:hypothetical protein